MDLKKGLTAPSKSIPCIYFYDKKGSSLFEKITRLPEYYLTSSEAEILAEYAGDIAELFPENTSLIELGSGSSIKTQYLIKAFLSLYGRLEYIPIDVSNTILKESADQLDKKYPGLIVKPVAARYKDGIELIEHRQNNPKLILWLGSSIGNYSKEGAADFIRHLYERLPAWDQLLLGIDLIKDVDILERAYNDPSGITARFNLNLLTRINREMGADFRLRDFSHRAIFNGQKGCIELFLESNRTHVVHIAALDLKINFKKGERIHTEDSHKYTLNEIKSLAEKTGLNVTKQWFDKNKWFSLNLLSTRTEF